VVFVIAFVLCAALTKSHVTSWNDGSRVAMVDALTANHSLAIDGSPFAAHLGDKILFHGKHYSDKPPLLALHATVVALAVAPLGITLRDTPGTAIYLITLFTVGVWFGIGCAYAYAFQRLLGFGARVAAAVAALTGAATLALPYAIVLTNHVPCGAAGLAGCYHLVRARSGGPVHHALAGLFFALAFAFDPAGVLLAIAGAVLLWGSPARRWLLCIVAGAPIVLLQLAYNVHVSGSILPTAFTGSVWSEFPHAAGSTPQPFELHSAGDYARFVFELLVGAKGLISFTPLVLVAVYGLVLMWRGGGVTRRITLAVAATCAVFFVTIVTLQNDVGAANFGERRYVDLFFLLCIGLGPALASVRSRAAAVAVRACIALSVAIAALGTVAPFGGAPGESGYAFGGAAFAALIHRAPVQAGVDVLALLVIVALVLRLVPFPASRPAAGAR
jgi:hypothetical protein